MGWVRGCGRCVRRTRPLLLVYLSEFDLRSLGAGFLGVTVVDEVTP
jgi:hypothetical protein